MCSFNFLLCTIFLFTDVLITLLFSLLLIVSCNKAQHVFKLHVVTSSDEIIIKNFNLLFCDVKLFSFLFFTGVSIATKCYCDVIELLIF